MIQRIQTLWFLAACACGLATLKLSFYSGNKMINEVEKVYTQLNATTNLLLLVLTVATAIASLILIFLFKDRKLQMKLTFITLLVSIINIVLFFVEIKKFVPAESNFNFTCVLAFAVPVFLILAFRGVYKDEKLVKSVDRLR